MNRRIVVSLATMACVLLTCGALFAHHGGAAWDMKTTLTLQGTVTDFRFVNPHVQIYFDAVDSSGKTVHWSCETADTSMLERQGWNRGTVKVGDKVTVIGHPAKTGVKVMVLEKITLPDGKVLDAKAIAG